MTRRVDPSLFQTVVTKPADFDAFWEATLAEADTIDPAPALVPIPLRSTDDVEVFELSFTSWDGIRIAGWYAGRPTARPTTSCRDCCCRPATSPSRPSRRIGHAAVTPPWRSRRAASCARATGSTRASRAS